MNARERILTTLAHRCPDRVPFDLGGTHVTGIHRVACRNLCRYLGLGDVPLHFSDEIQQVVIPPDALLRRLNVDTRGLFPLCSHRNVRGEPRDGGLEYRDEWGMVHRLPPDGHWWSLIRSPLDGPAVGPDDIRNHPWPNAALPERIAGLRAQAEAFRAAGHVVMLKGLCAGPVEMGQRLRGMEPFLCDLLAEPDMAAQVLDRVVELKMQFWDMALAELGDVVDIAVENDDYGTQESQLISPATFRDLLKPRLKTLFDRIRAGFSAAKPAGERGWIFFHSCGNVRPILPDFIEIGVDILNPVHTAAAGMEPVGLKRDFGADITFWGGGVETQQVLPRGRPAEVRDNVRRNLEALMPGGGFVFNTVHNIQAEVPPENIMAMWETLQAFGAYG